MRRVFVPCLVLLSSLAYLDLVQAQGSRSYKVIVNGDNPVSSASAAMLSRIFLKKITRWEDGTAIAPVDLTFESELRITFSESVHRRSLSQIGSYWQRMIFTGREVPPIILSNDEEVVAFVRENRGAVGYVARQANIGSGVRVLTIGE